MGEAEIRYRQCTRCIMDTSAPDIEFDESGRCNYCRDFEQRLEELRVTQPDSAKDTLQAFVREVRSAGRGKPYDCVVGVSGGVDSSWALVKAVEHGLRPLAVHMDNGWNSELAVHNIKGLIERLDVDLYTHVIDWPEYRGLMQAFFDADVIDVELLYDNAMLGVNYRAAKQHKVRHILGGTNTATEGMRMPPGWNWYKMDARHIRGLARSGGVQIRTFPAFGTLEWLRMTRLRNIRWSSFLDYFEYNKTTAVQELVERNDYKPYPYKHYESVFTRFYQGYILPEKFGIDKRKLHLSSLIISGEMSRQAAIQDIGAAPYRSERTLADDIQYFLKKMGWERHQLAEYLRRSPRSHAEFATERPLFDRINSAYQARKRWRSRFRRAGKLTARV